MTRKKKVIIATASSLAAVLVAYMAFAVPLANEAKRIGQYHNPNIQASLEAIHRNPNNAAAHSSAAYYYMAHNRGQRYDAQIAHHFRELVRIEPDNREGKFLLAYKLKKFGRRAEAQKLYRELAEQQDGWGKAAQKHLDKLKIVS